MTQSRRRLGCGERLHPGRRHDRHGRDAVHRRRRAQAGALPSSRSRPALLSINTLESNCPDRPIIGQPLEEHASSPRSPPTLLSVRSARCDAMLGADEGANDWKQREDTNAGRLSTSRASCAAHLAFPGTFRRWARCGSSPAPPTVRTITRRDGPNHLGL